MTNRLPPLLFMPVLSFALIAQETQKPAKETGKKVTVRKAIVPAKAPTSPPPPPATHSNVKYGNHERQVMDFWKAKSDKPTPLLFFIHGGGWMNGDKSSLTKFVKMEELLNAGISIVSINYRLVSQAHEAGTKPPVEWPLRDAARALQFVRSKASEWSIDKKRIGAAGGSAGACSSLWLAFHDDMAAPKSADPISRESTRLWCAAVVGAQTTLDPAQMKEWTPNSRYGGHAFGFMTDPKNRDSMFAEFLANRESVLPWIKEYSPYEWVSKDDPPVYLNYSVAPAPGQEQKDPTHTSNFGVKLQERAKSVGAMCDLYYPGATGVGHTTVQSYLLERLKAP
jgi:acetyl esterase/lipase